MSSGVGSALLPAALAFIMFSLGLTLVVADFRALLARPRALVVGLIGQVLLVPLLGALVAAFAGLPPAMAAGLMLLAACPGGVSSGLLTKLAGGEVALSIALTAVSSVLALLTLPLVLDLALRSFTGEALQVELPIGRTVRSMFLLTTVPVIAGMVLRAAWPRLVMRWEPVAGRVATALFVAIVLATFWSQRRVLAEQFAHLGLACLVLDAAIVAVAWFASRRLALTRPQSIAVATECGLQNAALGIFVATELLRLPALAVPSVVYALMMNIGAITFLFVMRRRSGAAAAA